jgi:hypothetical protein
MDLEEAKRVIHCELGAPLGRLFWATSVVTAPENDGRASLLDLVNCLRRGDTFRRRTEMHELAALALYQLRLATHFEGTMSSIIDQIGSFSFEKTQLFFDESRLGEEVRLNLVSIPCSITGIPDQEVSQVIDAIQQAVSKMEIEIGRLLKNRRAVFYMWHDDHAKLLRWTIISDLGQAKLPFSSKTAEVDIQTVVKEWAKVSDPPSLLTSNEIEKMTSAELRKISSANRIPTINVFVKRVSG